MEPSKIISAYVAVLGDQSYSRLPSDKFGLFKLATMLAPWDSVSDLKKQETTIIYPKKAIDRCYKKPPSEAQLNAFSENRSPTERLELYADLLCSV